MSTPETFDHNIALWKQEMDLPWAKLKYKLIHANLIKHFDQDQLHILDAGGGNGLDSVAFAAQGHFVDIVDYSQEMLANIQPHERVATHLADLSRISDLFPNDHFDVILCHNVIQYLKDVPPLIESLSRLLKPDGILSIVSINRHSLPYHAAFLNSNFSEAIALLDARISKAKIFDTHMTCYTALEICDLIEKNGLIVDGNYGIRCITDYWGDNERKSDPTIFEQIERLEFALTALHPYKLLARYFQIVARKTKST